MCIFQLVLSQAHSVSSSLLVNSTRAMHRAFEQATGGGAPQPAESTPDARRIALDGQAYTSPQCMSDCFRRQELAVTGAPRPGAPAEAGAPQPGAPAEDAEDNEEPTTAIDEGTQHEDAIPVLALPSVCNFQEMQEMQPVQGMGGKAACVKQRELRQLCLQNEVFEIDVTETWPEWRAVLRALPQQMQHLIIGHGITQVKFRLLEGSRDANYAKKDAGERHVFEILRVDTSAVHLHYHKNGSLDDPVSVNPIVMPQNAHSGASQPAAPLIGLAFSPSQPNIGRREAVLALTVLLYACWNNGAGAVDITDGHAFDWRRFLANTMEHLQIAAMELKKVFALRMADSGSPTLALCTTGTTWKMMDPTQTKYTNTRRPALRDMSSNWRTDPIFLQTQTLGRNWMRCVPTVQPSQTSPSPGPAAGPPSPGATPPTEGPPPPTPPFGL
jgi:hypothetical protein